jgi:SNF2 family DNA or RNA helicase
LDHGTLALLVRARQSCVYPQLIAKQLEKFVEINRLQDPAAFERATSCSSKLDAVQAHIAERKYNGRGKIVFCHYRGEIDELRTRLSEYEGMRVEVLDGRTSAEQRARIVNDTPDVLVLQVQTGCEGLNLQQFSEIYFVSPNWNPAVEDQAVARAHRIGQEHQVDVYRFIMEGFDDEFEEGQTLDIYSQNVQTNKRKAMRFVDGEIGEKDEDELKNIDKKYKTKEGYLKDGFTV